MCGIYGIIALNKANYDGEFFQKKLSQLANISESRGKEASGIAIQHDDIIGVHKAAKSSAYLFKSKSYKKMYNSIAQTFSQNSKFLLGIGHSRLVTNGMQAIPENNQPIISDGVIVIHNGIIVNHEELWSRFPELVREHEVDTEIIPKLIVHLSKKNSNLPEVIAEVFGYIYGETSIAVLDSTRKQLALATNTGSVYYAKTANEFVFLSENQMMRNYLKLDSENKQNSIVHLKANNGLLYDLTSNTFQEFSLFSASSHIEYASSKKTNTVKLIHAEPSLQHVKENIKRCSKCLLTVTMPFICFDSDGVCNFCQHYQQVEYKDIQKLEAQLERYRKGNGEPDCIVAFSGGRDSSYVLHVLKTVYGMQPLAYSYDWGMVTDLARRNQARMCHKLGIEHVWISADIKKKRENIHKNVKAWLKRPDLGMVPLFMAGDKQYFYYANKLMQENNIDLMVFGENPYEKTSFKSGFCGVKPVFDQQSVYKLSFLQRHRMIFHYLTNFILNPSYINSSMVDTFKAFLSYYHLDHDYLHLFQYINWDENEINQTLISNYEWEVATDTTSTWRIGDGTAAFYNFIYDTVAGFSEYDTFKSNQVRQGLITRENAFEQLLIESRPRYHSIQEYLTMINLDFDTTLAKIRDIKKLKGIIDVASHSNHFL
jgi:hypothetical protein